MGIGAICCNYFDESVQADIEIMRLASSCERSTDIFGEVDADTQSLWKQKLDPLQGLWTAFVGDTVRTLSFCSNRRDLLFPFASENIAGGSVMKRHQSLSHRNVGLDAVEAVVCVGLSKSISCFRRKDRGKEEMEGELTLKIVNAKLRQYCSVDPSVLHELPRVRNFNIENVNRGKIRFTNYLLTECK